MGGGGEENIVNNHKEKNLQENPLKLGHFEILKVKQNY